MLTPEPTRTRIGAHLVTSMPGAHSKEAKKEENGLSLPRGATDLALHGPDIGGVSQNEEFQAADGHARGVIG